MSFVAKNLGDFTKIRTGKLDANASSEDGQYPFFTCARQPLRISKHSYDCECVLVAGNGDLNIKYYEGKFDAYQRTYIIEVRPDSENDIYLRYVFHFLEKYLEKLREQSIGGIIKYIKLGNLTNAQIPLPPLAEQKRIAAILDAADALRAKRRESLAQLDTLLQSTFHDMFGDPVTNPKGWETSTLGDVTIRVTDGTHQSPNWSESGIPFLFVSNIRDRQIDFNTSKFISEREWERLTSRCPVETGDILYTTVGSYGNPVAIKKGTRRFAFQRHIAHVKPNHDLIDPCFLEVMLDSPVGRNQADRLARGVAQKTLNLRELKSFMVFLPPLDEQHRFATIVESVEQQKARLRAHLAELDTLFASLQSLAFKGEL